MKTKGTANSVMFLLDIAKQFYLINRDQEVLLYDSMDKPAEDYVQKMAKIIKVLINKDIDKRLMQELKF
jgi:hypothetical protein